MLVRGSAVVAAGVLAVAARAAAQPQQVVLPGPVPYPTVSPPLSTYTPTPVNPTRYVFHIASTQRVRVGVGEEGQPTAVRVLQRLDVSGKGDYQFGIPGPISDVQAAPDTDSQPGLRVNQLLWVGFSPGRKVLAADVTLRPRQAAPYLPVRLELKRESGGATLAVTNATGTPVLEYAGVVRPPEIARLLDETRRAAQAGARVAPAHATFYSLVRERRPQPVIEAPVHVEGELRLPGGNPVRFSRTLGDGGPLSLRVHATGSGPPQVALSAVPVPVDRLLRPPGGATWRATVARRPLPGPLLLRRLLDTRNMLVRADQYHTFLQNPDADGRNRIVYEYSSAAPAPRAAAPAPKSSSGSGAGGVLVVLLAVGASLLVAGAAIVAWAHS
jgi:hypothetical protein